VLYNTIVGLLSQSGDRPAPSAVVSQNAVQPARQTASLNGAEVLVLVAEDHPVNQEVALLQLQQLGIAAHAVANGREALEALKRTPYTLVLMDCQMPEMDGYEATRQLRRAEADTGKHVPVIAMTAHAMQGDRETCLAAGMDDYISKPVSIDRLRAALYQWLPRAPAAPEPAPAGAVVSLPPAVAEGETVDFMVIEDLRSMQGDDHEFLSRLIGTFFAQTDPLLDRMDDAAKRGDAEALWQASHKLKGGCAVLGIKNLAGIAYGLELQGRAGNLDGVGEKVTIARAEYARVKATLAQELQGEHV
jgi:CheY-like chemotaxis protein/HPt (histidine-containing phosphotransfer) domain-containing protein